MKITTALAALAAPLVSHNSDIELYAGEAYCAQLSTSCVLGGLNYGQVWNGEVTYAAEVSSVQ